MSKEEKDEKIDNPKADPKPEEIKEKKIKIDISRDPEVDSLQQELANIKSELESVKEKSETDKQDLEAKKLEMEDKVTAYEAEKTQAALEQFEKDKKDVLELCKVSGLKEEQITEITGSLTTPQQLETVKSLVAMLASTIPKDEDKTKDEGNDADKGKEKEKAPAGKAQIIPPPTDEVFEDRIKKVDEIYAIINDRTGKYTAQQKKEAQELRLKLWNAAIHGKAWGQLKEGASFGTRTETMACPQCGATITGPRTPEKCQNCGFDFTKTGDRKPINK